MRIEFGAEIWYWKGPAPFHFVTVPEAESAEIKSIAKSVSYGWGMIPVTVTMADQEWYTALFEKDGKYIVPLRAKERKAVGAEIGDFVQLSLEIKIEEPL